MASISFGNLNTVDGRTTLSGGQSGIDTGALVKSLAEAKRLPAVALETDITLNKSKITQLNTLESKLKTLQDALGKLRRPGGLNASASDVFSARLPFLTSSDGTAAANYLGVVAKNGAAIKDYDITITNLAVSETRKSLAFTSRTGSVVNASGDETAGKFSAGTFTINGVNVTLAEDDSLNSVVAKINAKTNTTNVEASILKVNETDFRLIISSTETGTDNAITITDAVDSVFVGGLAASIFTSVTAAENATLTIDGEAITRQSNVISDAIDNLTFSLFQETDELATTPTIKVDIDKDSTKVSEAIVGFIDAYNDLRIFYGTQNERDDDNQFVETAVLSNSSLLDSVSSSIVNSLLTIVGVANPFEVDDGSAPKSLTNLGITFADFDGDLENEIASTTSILELDGAALTEKIESNFDAVQDLFGFELNSTSTNLVLFERVTVVPNERYTLVIDDTQIIGQQAKITHIDGKELASAFFLTYDTSDPSFTATISGTGALAGFEYFYTGDGTSTEAVDATIADGKKDYTIAVDATLDTAKITHIRGLALTTAVDLVYTASATGGTITGAEGGLLEELTFLHLGTSSESIDISYSQGFADKVYNYLEEVLNGTGDSIQGIIQDEIDSLKDSNDSLQVTIERIDAQIVTYREQLLTKFAALEAAIAASNSVLDLLTAQTNAQNAE